MEKVDERIVRAHGVKEETKAVPIALTIDFDV